MRNDHELVLDRKIFTNVSTIGELIDTDRVTRLCFTLEDTCRKVKIAGETAIPAGRYRIEFAEFSNTGKMYPMLIDVPFFIGVFMHGGNIPKNTRGCPLVGMRHGDNIIYDSQKALNEIVIPRIKELQKTGDVYLNVVGGYAKEEWEERHAKLD